MALGTFSAPSTWRLDEVVAAFLERHPNLTVRFLSRNSSAIAERVRRGELEAGVVLLPVDDQRLDVRPLVRDELLYVSADPGARAARHDRAARIGPADLLRRRVGRQRPDPPAARRARAGAGPATAAPRGGGDGRARARPRRRGIGDTYLPVSYTHAPYYPAGLHHRAFAPALYNTFAIVTRPGARLAPGTRELLAGLETHMHALADEFDR